LSARVDLSDASLLILSAPQLAEPVTIASFEPSLGPDAEGSLSVSWEYRERAAQGMPKPAVQIA
jgi:hypothetical protein